MRKLSPVAGNNVLLKANKGIEWRRDIDYVRITIIVVVINTAISRFMVELLSLFLVEPLTKT